MKQAMLVLCWIAFWVDPVGAQIAEEKQQTIAALQALQQPDGGFRAVFDGASKESQTKSSLRATTSALRALKYFGGQAKDKESCAAFVHRCFEKATGGFADKPGGSPDATTTAIGVMAVVEVKLPVKDYSEAASSYLAKHATTFEEVRLAAAAMEAIEERSPQTETWLAQIGKLRNEDGTYGKGDGIARATSGAVAAILRLGGTVERRDNVLRALKSGQRSDGGFGQEGKRGSDLETSYRVTRAFHMLKEKPDSERLRAFIGKCRNADGGYGIAPGQPSQVGSTYFAAIILHWLED
jgi:prenyltransferase beta subunit